jgi:hypothetical protein
MSAPLSFQSRVVVVTQPARAASAGNAPPAWFGPPLLPSVARGVFHEAKSAKSIRSFDRSGFSARFAWPPPEPSELCGVGHPVRAASAGSAPPAWFGPPLLPSVARGVFHGFRNPPEPLSDMGRADARSAEINRPAGVARSFQVSLYKVEPTEAVLARNLLAKDDWRAALADEMEPAGPYVPLVSKPCTFARRAERLAGEAGGPTWPGVGPPGSPEGV